MSAAITVRRLPSGETLVEPAALKAAIDEACILPIDGDEELEAGRDAFTARFLEALFRRDLLLVPRGRPGAHDCVSVDTYSLICSQKHAAERRIGELQELIQGTPAEPRPDLLEAFAGLLDALTGHAPPADPSTRYTLMRRLLLLRCAVLNLPAPGDDLDPGEGGAIR